MFRKVVICSSHAAVPERWMGALAGKLGAAQVSWTSLRSTAADALSGEMEEADTMVFLLLQLDGAGPEAVSDVVRSAWQARVAAELSGVRRVVLVGAPNLAARESDLSTARRLVSGVFAESAVPLTSLFPVALDGEGRAQRSIFSRLMRWWQSWQAEGQSSVDDLLQVLTFEPYADGALEAAA